MQDVFDEPAFQGLLQGLEIFAEKPWDLYKMVACDSEASVHIDEFVSKCMYLRGPAKQVSVIKRFHEQWEMHQSVLNHLDTIAEALHDVSQRMTSRSSEHLEV